MLDTDLGKEFNSCSGCNGTGYESSNPVPIPSMSEEIKAVMKQPIFLCLIAGYAAQTAALIGLSTFGSAFGMGLGYFNSETSASAAFGVTVSIAGMLGTPLGGLMLDRLTKSSKLIHDSNPHVTLRTATLQIFCLSICGLFFLLLVCITKQKIVFLTLLCLGSAFCFSTSTGISIGVMETVPSLHRSFAIAMLTVCIHLFGDVPSPVLVGWLKDVLAPHCVDGPGAATGDACRKSEKGLRVTMAIVVMWLFWSVFFFGMAWRLSVRKSRRYTRLRFDLEGEATSGSVERGEDSSPVLSVASIPPVGVEWRGDGSRPVHHPGRTGERHSDLLTPLVPTSTK